MITHGVPDSLYSMTIRVMSSTDEVNGISGAEWKELLADRTDSTSGEVVISLRKSSIVRANYWRILS